MHLSQRILSFLADWAWAACHVCLHPSNLQIWRRGPADAMGFECLRCGRWRPIPLERSPLAYRLARQQRHARERAAAKPATPRLIQPIVFPSKKGHPTR